MVVAPGTGRFAAPFSRMVRVMVCMDRSRPALDATGARCAGGCRTELFQRDWDGYVPARGRYDSVVVCPSSLCADLAHLMRTETVSKRSCAVLFPSGDEYAGMLARVIGRTAAEPGPEALIARLEEDGRSFVSRTFVSDVSVPEGDLAEALKADAIAMGVPDPGRKAEEAASGVSRDGTALYSCGVRAVAWDLDG